MILDNMQTITFSKDRPWQLSEHLRSYRRFATGIQFVIYKASNAEIAKCYATLKEQYRNSEVVFVNQDKYISFITALRAVFDMVSASYLAFTVDDVFFYDTDESVIYLSNHYLFRDPDDVYSMRLHSDCTFCQPANQLNTMPTINQCTYYQWFYYQPGRGFGDWYYPLEVSASIYATSSSHIRTFAAILNDSTIRHPNDLEARWSATATQAHHVFFPRNRICSTVTINRVQDDYPNPVGPVTLSVEDGLSYFHNCKQFDERAYRNAKFQSIHVNYLALKDRNV